MKRQMTLTYDLGEGWLRPWLDGLREGRAVASSCRTSGAAHFPPLRVCPFSGCASDGWVTLPGTATILHRTSGTDGDIALVRFDGAASATVLRCDCLPADARRGVLRPCGDGPPVLALDPEEMK